MIDIDALIKNSEIDRNNFHVFFQKIKKTAKNVAKLAPKIRKVVQSRDFVYSNPLYLYLNGIYSTLD